MRRWASLVLVALNMVTTVAVADAAKVEFQWGAKIPLRDGVQLNATVYTPKGQKVPAPCVV
ncbi:hypothetical protein, partial [Steroidobacter sp.]|uniref:hypothetical protein n=1 Tax=Steroidobacter sp. TaxID=1978227 RepID=UPI001A4075C4